ncbi:MAG: hypothetical protein MUP44_07860, partial [Anaerolineales bacterium]|nr:hypothetical protein [Anaerolineales bacterium]
IPFTIVQDLREESRSTRWVGNPIGVRVGTRFKGGFSAGGDCIWCVRGCISRLRSLDGAVPRAVDGVLGTLANTVAAG